MVANLLFKQSEVITFQANHANGHAKGARERYMDTLHKSLFLRRVTQVALLISIYLLSPLLTWAETEEADIPSPLLVLSDQQSWKKQKVAMLLELTHVSSIVSHTDELLINELKNLKGASHVGYSQEDFERIEAQMKRMVEKNHLYGSMIDMLVKQLPDEVVDEAFHLLSDPLVSEIRQLEHKTRQELDLDQYRAYKIKLSQAKLAEDRQQVVEDLMSSTQVPDLGSHLRVEIRKNLLQQVTQVMNKQTISEQLLNKQLQSYYSTVMAELSDRMRSQYFYTFRSVPSSKLSEYHDLIQDETVQKFISQANVALQAYFQSSREQNQVAGVDF